MHPDLEKINSLPTLKDVIASHDLKAQKALGQNFLLDSNITDKIARLAFEPYGDITDLNVFEIGPGPGGLTRSLLKHPINTLTAIEFDKRAVGALQDLKALCAPRFDLIHGDAMGIDLTELSDAPRAVVANLPYNIATPLLIGWLKQICSDQSHFSSLTVMVQKEVAQRIIAQDNSKAYGRLSIISQLVCECRIVYHLPPSAFTPPPKVDSAVVQLMPKPQVENLDLFETLERITSAAFGQRRKMIRSSLKDYRGELEALDLNETLRAENLSVTDYLNIAQAVQSR